MNAVPLSLKRAIGVGIGLFILFIGFADGGLIVARACLLSSSRFPNNAAAVRVRDRPVDDLRAVRAEDPRRADHQHCRHGGDRVRGRRNAASADTVTLTPSFATLGVGLQDPFQVFARLNVIVAMLTIFAIMLADFFDTMGTVTGRRCAGRPGSRRRLRTRCQPSPGRRQHRGDRRRRRWRVVQYDVHRECRGRRRRRPNRLRLGRHRRAVLRRDAAGAAHAVHPGRSYGAGTRPRRLPDVHARP